MSLKTSALIATPFKLFSSIFIAVIASYLSYLIIKIVFGTWECPLPLGLNIETSSTKPICNSGLFNNFILLVPIISFIASLRFSYIKLGKVVKY